MVLETLELNSLLAVAFDRPGFSVLAESLASDLALRVAKKFHDPHPMHLAVAEDAGERGFRLELRVVERGHPLSGGHGVFADLTKLDTTSPAGRSLKTPLLKAVGLGRAGKGGRPRVLDATAGLGEDAWLLAAAGCSVTAVERHPVVHALLVDALQRAGTVSPDVAAQISVQPCIDAAEFMREKAEAESYDVVLIDPMFPGADRRKTTERKPMRVLRWLVGDDDDADDLLDLARATATRRVVVKRPRHAPHLAGVNPVATHEGRGMRFELVMPTPSSPKAPPSAGR
ncbi:MAG: class I SAM-dependent methyltransferase [Planctomycetota bacterium]